MTAFLLSAAGLVLLALSFVLPAVKRQRATAGVLGVAVPLLAGALYALLGNPKALDAAPLPLPTAEQRQAAQEANRAQATAAQVEGMVARLATRLQSQPDDAEGWRMLAKSYENLGRFDQAAQAYANLNKLTPNDPAVLTDYALALGMADGHSLSGEPEKLINRALQIDPDNVQALALLGGAAFDRHDYAQAVVPWKKVLALVPPDSGVARSIAANIEKAQALAAQAKSSPSR